MRGPTPTEKFFSGKRVLITGASSGIGAAVVERLSGEGLQVHAVARSAASLAALAERTARMADAYGSREGVTSAHELRQTGSFVAGLVEAAEYAFKLIAGQRATAAAAHEATTGATT